MRDSSENREEDWIWSVQSSSQIHVVWALFTGLTLFLFVNIHTSPSYKCGDLGVKQKSHVSKSISAKREAFWCVTVSPDQSELQNWAIDKIQEKRRSRVFTSQSLRSHNAEQLSLEWRSHKHSTVIHVFTHPHLDHNLFARFSLHSARVLTLYLENNS